ncbi:MAG: AmmeMemoRadiSam system radical SAM enzyme [Candidatus Caenarcaniphilales bacterium]|nr:AmmeMemoRadiSam system radical SAM enzyme [Candidatus Caenarcaniphilales bacterium]
MTVEGQAYSPRTDKADPAEKDLLEELVNLRKPIAGDVPVSDLINPLVREGKLYRTLDNQMVHCFACEHNCKIKQGTRGICQVRYNLNGKLYVPWGYVAALQCDPIEKKPFFHVHPGTDTLTYGMMGCDLHCAYCQNWDISQTLRDANAGRPPVEVTPKQLVSMAKKYGAKTIASSYNEPLITSEWSHAIFEEAQKEGLTCMYVSNGNATREVLEYIRPFMKAYKIDFKTMRDKSYRRLGTALDRVLNGIKMVHELGLWLELVTLIVPGFNDSEEELRDAAKFIKSISPDIPWHVTAFHTDYRMQETENTDSDILIKATEIGYEEGLHYVYPGNRPGKVGRYEHTYCPNCKAVLIERIGYVVLNYHISDTGQCPHCNTSIPGIWPKSKSEVRLGTVYDLYNRVPKALRI